MSRAAHFRVSSLYFLIGMNIVVLVILVCVTGYVASLGNQIEDSRATQRAACERGNVLRAAAEHLLRKEGSPSSAALAEHPLLQRQPCTILYPE